MSSSRDDGPSFHVDPSTPTLPSPPVTISLELASISYKPVEARLELVPTSYWKVTLRGSKSEGRGDRIGWEANVRWYVTSLAPLCHKLQATRTQPGRCTLSDWWSVTRWTVGENQTQSSVRCREWCRGTGPCLPLVKVLPAWSQAPLTPGFHHQGNPSGHDTKSICLIRTWCSDI